MRQSRTTNKPELHSGLALRLRSRPELLFELVSGLLLVSTEYLHTLSSALARPDFNGRGARVDKGGTAPRRVDARL